MSFRLRTIDSMERALAHAPELDRRAEEFQRQFSDDPFPEGASERFLRQRFDQPETLLLVAEDGATEAQTGLCLIGAFEDPLLGRRTPTVLVLYVDVPWRHRGLAGALIRRALEVLAERGTGPLAARVGHNDDALISMGERWGFVRLWEFMLRE